MMSNMASEEKIGAEKTPSTSVPTHEPESSRIKEILSRVSASNADKYLEMLQDSGFDSLEALTLGFTDFRSVFPVRIIYSGLFLMLNMAPLVGCHCNSHWRWPAD